MNNRIEEVRKSQQSTGYSRRTLARLEAAKESLLDVQESMIKDFAKSPDVSPDSVYSSLAEIKTYQNEIEALSEQISSQTNQDFNQDDVEEMRRLKGQNMSENKIAKRFLTNQSKVNRLLNQGIK